MATILHFELLSGASGDMILGALCDLGVPVTLLHRELSRLAIPGLRIGAKKVKRNGIVCTQMAMRWKTPREYRHVHDILGLIKKARFKEPIYERASSVLQAIAEAEATAHGIPTDHVHFHEIGAVDTIVDIVGACIAIDYLGVERLTFGTLTEGNGTITTEHGVMPVPAPATAALIKGYHVTRLPVPTELLTPTGAALLTTLGTQELVCPAGAVIGCGNGCGTKSFDTHPNFLRVSLIDTATVHGGAEGDTVTLIETDMDHLTGEVMGSVAALLMERGALDVSWIPLYMKKGRPGYRLTVIGRPDSRTELIDLVMRHTRTLGVRVQSVQRVTAQRETVKGALDGTPLREKRCSYKGYTHIKAEHDDLEAIARSNGLTVLDVAERYGAVKRLSPGTVRSVTRRTKSHRH